MSAAWLSLYVRLSRGGYPRALFVRTGVALLLVCTFGCGEEAVDLSALARTSEAMGMALPSADPTRVTLESQALQHLGGFPSPMRLTLAEDGLLYVVDSRTGIVSQLDPASGARRDVVEGLQHPLGLAVNLSPGGPEVFRKCMRLPPQLAARSPRCLEGLPGVRNAQWNRRSTPRIYVGESADGSVRAYEKGKERFRLGAGGGEFVKPNAIAVDADGSVYVVDSDAAVIKVYSDDGQPKFTFGATPEGRLDYPTGLVIDSNRGVVYVSEFGRGVVEVFDLEGTWLETLQPPLNEQGEAIVLHLAGLGLEPDGTLLLVDNGLGCVARMSPSGALQGAVGYREKRYWTGELVLPLDAASDGKRMYVASNGAKRISVFEVTP